MRHVTDEMIDALVKPEDAQRVLEEAFRSFDRGDAAMQERIRTEAGGVKLSTLGAVIPEQKVAGAKVYTTINGQFSFVILLFSTSDGRPLASFDAQAITRLRTAACSVLAARHLARAGCNYMALFGAGVQGRAHAVAMAQAFALKEIRISDPHATPQLTEQVQRACATKVRICGVAEALDGADIVVTASRSASPLFRGDQLPQGCFVAAIGSSLPYTRELDDRALERAACIAVEWLPQAQREAGDLVLASMDALDRSKLVELGALISGRAIGRRSETDITLYKAVGVGLQDVALAGLAWKELQSNR